MQTKNKRDSFMRLEQGTIFGDYQSIFKLTSNINFQAAPDIPGFVPDEKMPVSLMCCATKTFHEICELYPKTFEDLKRRALERRAVHMHYLMQAEAQPSEQMGSVGSFTVDDGAPVVSRSSMKKQQTDVETPEASKRISPFSECEDFRVDMFPDVSLLPAEYFENPEFFPDEYYKKSD